MNQKATLHTTFHDNHIESSQLLKKNFQSTQRVITITITKKKKQKKITEQSKLTSNQASETKN